MNEEQIKEKYDMSPKTASRTNLLLTESNSKDFNYHKEGLSRFEKRNSSSYTGEEPECPNAAKKEPTPQQLESKANSELMKAKTDELLEIIRSA